MYGDLPVRRLVWLLLLFLFPSMVDAATRYVRPLGGSYGTEDGTSYANAFDGFVDITGINASDTLYVCGLHRETLTVTTSTLTVRLDCPSDTGSIHGSVLDDGTGWSGPDVNGNWSKTYATQPRVVARDPSFSPYGTTATILVKGTAQAGLATGAFFWASNVLYIHENPVGHSYEVGQRDRNITFPNSAVTDLTVIGGSSTCSVDRTVACGQINFSNWFGIADGDDAWINDRNNLMIQNLYFFGNREQSVHQDNSSTAQFDSITVTGGAFLETGGEAIYINNLRSAGVVTVARNQIGSYLWNNSGWDGNHGAYTGDGIDVNPADTLGNFRAVITDNTILNMNGDAIVFTGTDAIIARNVIRDASDLAGTNTAAVLLQPGTTGTYGIIFSSNDIRQVSKNGHGINACGAAAANTPTYYIGNFILLNDTATWNAVHQTCNKTGNHKYLNNTIVGGRSGLFTDKTFTLAGGYFINNLVVGQQFPINMANTTIGTWTATNNNFQPLSTQANPFAFNGSSYATVAAIDTGEASWLSNLSLSPGFVSDTDYRLSSSSPIRRGGVTVAGCVDVRGRACFHPPDIGAYQMTGGDMAAIRTVALTRSTVLSRSGAAARISR